MIEEEFIIQYSGLIVMTASAMMFAYLMKKNVIEIIIWGAFTLLLGWEATVLLFLYTISRQIDRRR